MIWDFIDQFTKKNIIDEKQLVKVDRAYYLTDPSLRRILVNTKQKALHAGLFLGRDVSSGFIPSTHLLQLLVPVADKTITLHKKGAWLCICARDIFSESIVKSTGNPKKGDLVLILNEYKECIGIGKATQKISARGLVVKNLLDIGWFARKKVRAIKL